MEKECCICLKDLKINIIKLNCNHCFHLECINRWRYKKNTCPICRTIITNKKRILNKNDILIYTTIFCHLILFISFIIILIKNYFNNLNIFSLYKNTLNQIDDKAKIFTGLKIIKEKMKIINYFKNLGVNIIIFIINCIYEPKKYISNIFGKIEKISNIFK